MQPPVLTSARMGCLGNRENSNLSLKTEEWCALCLRYVQKQVALEPITKKMKLFPTAVVRVDLRFARNFLLEALHNSVPFFQR